MDSSTPAWVKRRDIEHADHTNAYPLVNDLATLVWLAQIAAIEIHVPQWRFGPRGARRNPDRMVSNMKKSLRSGKVLADWSQNNGSKTTITPYSLRGRAYPTVAASRTWQELSSPELAQLDYREVLDRVKKSGDLLGDLDTTR